MEKLIGQAASHPPNPAAAASPALSSAATNSVVASTPALSSAAPADASVDAPVWRLHHLPDDVLRVILRLLPEQALRRVAQVCRRLRALADDPGLWRALYQQLFRYDRPLLHPARGVFQFVAPQDADDANPWKKSFQQLRHGVHVRPGYGDIALRAPNIKFFDTVHHALDFTKRHICNSHWDRHHALIFIHAGTHSAGIIIDCNVALLGAAAGNVMESVILESKCVDTIKIGTGASLAYIGHLTIKYSFDPRLSIIQHEYSCLKVTEYCSPSIEYCIIRSTSLYGSAVRVCGHDANPTIKYCHISECRGRGLRVDDNGLGTYENNLICSNRLSGIWVNGMANPIIRQNTVCSGEDVGIRVSGKGLGCFQDNEVSNNRVAAFEVTDGANPVVVDNDLGSGDLCCVYVHHGGSGVFVNNKICSKDSPGICILSSDPTFKSNKIHNCKDGVYITASRRSIIEGNDIFGCASTGVRIVNSDPILLENRIHHGKLFGIRVSDRSKGYIHKNDVYSNHFHGILIETASTSFIQQNRIYSGRIGVCFQNGGGGDLTYNVIFNNEYANIKIATGSNPRVRRNKIRSGRNAGVLISNEGLGMLEENDIYDNEVANVWIRNLSNPTVRRNKIFQGKGCGVFVFNNGMGILEQNQIFSNLHSAICICSQSHPIVRDNRIFYGLGAGVEIDYNASATLEYNQIFNNRFSGLSFASDVSPIMKENLICSNENAEEIAVANNQCLHALSSAPKVLHDFYTCRTCQPRRPTSVCVSCVRNCHCGHDVSYVRRGRFLCACGLGALMAGCRLRGEPPPLPVPHADD